MQHPPDFWADVSTLTCIVSCESPLLVGLEASCQACFVALRAAATSAPLPLPLSLQAWCPPFALPVMP